MESQRPGCRGTSVALASAACGQLGGNARKKAEDLESSHRNGVSISCGESCARFAHMFSADLEGHAPSWPCARAIGDATPARPSMILVWLSTWRATLRRGRVPCASRLPGGIGRDPSASLHDTGLVVDLEGHAPSWPCALAIGDATAARPSNTVRPVLTDATGARPSIWLQP